MTPDDMINDVLGLDQETLNDQEFYIGEIFEGKYPPEAAIWCNSHNAFIEALGDGRYEIKEVIIPAPTREDIEEARIAYRRRHIDNETLRRMRKQANNTWTPEDETVYLALDAEVTAYIEEHFPYPEEQDV